VRGEPSLARDLPAGGSPVEDRRINLVRRSSNEAAATFESTTHLSLRDRMHGEPGLARDLGRSPDQLGQAIFHHAKPL